MWKESVARELRSVATCGCTCSVAFVDFWQPAREGDGDLHLPRARASAPNGTRRGGVGVHGRGAQKHLAKGALVDGEGALAEGVSGIVVAEARLDDREVVEGDRHLRARRALSNSGRETMREKRQKSTKSTARGWMEEAPGGNGGEGSGHTCGCSGPRAASRMPSASMRSARALPNSPCACSHTRARFPSAVATPGCRSPSASRRMLSPRSQSSSAWSARPSCRHAKSQPSCRHALAVSPPVATR